jgi:hypothetical protein
LARSQQVPINPHFPKLIHQNGNPAALGILQQMAQQGGFARAQKAGNNGNGNFVHGYWY